RRRSARSRAFAAGTRLALPPTHLSHPVRPAHLSGTDASGGAGGPLAVRLAAAPATHPRRHQPASLARQCDRLGAGLPPAALCWAARRQTRRARGFGAAGEAESATARAAPALPER